MRESLMYNPASARHNFKKDFAHIKSIYSTIQKPPKIETNIKAGLLAVTTGCDWVTPSNSTSFM